MRVPASWRTLGLSTTRMLVLSSSVGACAAVVVLVAAIPILGGISWAFGAVVGAATGYLVASDPKRSLERSAILQAREAPSLAASAAVYLQSTGSRARTLLMLRSDEPRLAALLEGARKSTLLGVDLPRSLNERGIVQSDSIAVVLSAVVRAQGDRLYDDGQETDGMVSGAVAREETKFPAFLTVSFFTPMMLMLVAAIGHHDDILSVASLAVLEVVILDLVLSFSSTDRRRLAP